MTFTRFSEAQNYLLDELRSMASTGADGFEGAIADALSEVTGQRFAVTKSGHQDGSDARNDPANNFRLAFEAKQRKSRTGLSLDSLLYKITEAARLPVPPDLWILATTKPVDASAREKLHAHGSELGLGILVFDVPKSETRLSDLGALCALGRDRLASLFKDPNKMKAALDWISEHEDFQAISQQIIVDLTRGDVGFDAAKRTSRKWLLEAQQSPANAKSRFGSPANLSHSVSLVKRAQVLAKITEWHSKCQGAAVLLGDEGVGKTWAALDWMNDQLAAINDAPLLVYLKAAQIASTDARGAIAAALRRQTGIQSEAFWRKRLALWERADTVRLTIILDGLNENFQFEAWENWLQPLFEDAHADVYRVLMTSWPNWWTFRLSRLASLIPSPREIEVKSFDDAELDRFLEHNDLNRAAVTRPALELMRVPRLSKLVIKYREELRKSGDVTAERVIYEDWKDRLAQSGNRIGMSHEEMRDFVSELGARLQQAYQEEISRQDVLNALNVNSGKTGLQLEPAIEALTSGSWLTQGDRPHLYKVSHDRVAFVLGAALADSMRTQNDLGAARAHLAGFLDPLKAHSIGTAILRAATTILLIETPDHDIACDAVLEAWLSEQNFQAHDFEAYWRLAGLAPTRFIKMAEVFWCEQRGHRTTDEVLIKSLSNASEFEGFNTHLLPALERWLGTIWPDPRNGEFLEKLDLTTPDSLARAQATRDALQRWQSSPCSADWPQITLSDDRSLSWLCFRAIAVLSYMPRAATSSVFAAWAIGRAIMDHPRHQDEVAWALRVNPQDPEPGNAAIGDVIDRLAGTQNPIGETAASWLLEAMTSTERAAPETQCATSDQAPAAATDATEQPNQADLRSLLVSPHFGRIDSEELQTALSEFLSQLSPDSDADIALLTEQVDKLAPLMTPLDRSKAVNALEAAPASSGDNDRARMFARFIYRAMDASGADQCQLMLTEPLGPLPRGWTSMFRTVPFETLKTMDVSDATPDQLVTWLNHLRRQTDPKDAPEPIGFLSTLVGANYEPAIRDEAVALASRLRDKAALAKFAEGPDRHAVLVEDKPDRNADHRRTRALLELYDYDPPRQILDTLDPQAAALILENRPDDPEALERFEAFFRAELERAETSRKWYHPTYWFSYREEVEALCNHDPARFTAWFSAFLDRAHKSLDHGLSEDFPYLDILQALIPHDADLAYRLYDAVTHERHVRLFTRSGTSRFLFALARATGDYDRIDKMLEEAHSDATLQAMSLWALRFGCADWLFETIKRLEAGSHPSDLAKAYTLLGLTGQTEAADALWSDFASRPPASEWLFRVYTDSLNAYAQNLACKNRFDAFWSADDPFEAYSHYAYLSQFVDDRIHPWIKADIPKLTEDNRHLLLVWGLGAKKLETNIKWRQDQRAKQLFHTRRAFSTMSPWI